MPQWTASPLDIVHPDQGNATLHPPAAVVVPAGPALGGERSLGMAIDQVASIGVAVGAERLRLPVFHHHLPPSPA